MEERMRQQLARRQTEGSLRRFLPLAELSEAQRYPDFSSNDYLGLAHCQKQRQLVESRYKEYIDQHSDEQPTLGATGSRLLSGDSVLCRSIEEQLAEIHNRPAALLCNSGYDANLSVVSSIPLRGDVVLYDSLCHNSLIMGLKSSRVETSESFRHNHVGDLERLLQEHHGTTSSNILIIVESVYSMDGDVAPLSEILNLAEQYQAQVIVDEAHGLGLYGRSNRNDLGLSTTEDSRNQQQHDQNGGTGVLAALNLETHPALLCSIHTFGKAAGCHGAVICGSMTLKNYLLNYARPFIYSTALPTHSLIAIQCSYKTMISSSEGDMRRKHVFGLVRLFRELLLESLVDSAASGVSLWPSPSPIQALVVPGNAVCVEFCTRVKKKSGILLFPIRAPTVPLNQERVRIILHAHNTDEEVRELVQCLLETLEEMDLFLESRRPSRSKL